MKPYDQNRPDWYKRLSTGPFAGRTFTNHHVERTMDRLRNGKVPRRRRIAVWGAAAVLLCGVLTFCWIKGYMPELMPAAEPTPPVKATTNPLPSTQPGVNPTYMDEATAIRIAKQSNADPSVKWTATFSELIKPDPYKEETVPGWIVEGVYPAGNKDIFRIDGVTGKVIYNTEIEAPGVEEHFSQPLDGRSIKMVDGKTGWLLTGTGIWHTTSGPSGWVKAGPEGAALGGKPGGQDVTPRAAFLDESSSVLAVPQENNSTVSVYRTSDAGKTWKRSDVKSTFSPNGQDTPFVTDLSFTDNNHGWMLLGFGVAMGSEPVEIYRTTDGGATWKKASGNKLNEAETNGLPFGGLKYGLTFADSQHGYLAGYSHGPGVWFYATADGGTTWSKRIISLPAGLSDESVVTQSPQFPTAKDGFLPVQSAWKDASLLFFVTHDAGLTWKPTAPLALKLGNPAAYSFLDAKRGYVTDGVSLFETKDGANTWQAVNVKGNVLDGVQQLQFWSEQSGVAITDKRLVMTNDGGRTWETAW